MNPRPLKEGGRLWMLALLVLTLGPILVCCGSPLSFLRAIFFPFRGEDLWARSSEAYFHSHTHAIFEAIEEYRRGNGGNSTPDGRPYAGPLGDEWVDRYRLRDNAAVDPFCTRRDLQPWREGDPFADERGAQITPKGPPMRYITNGAGRYIILSTGEDNDYDLTDSMAGKLLADPSPGWAAGVPSKSRYDRFSPRPRDGDLIRVSNNP